MVVSFLSKNKHVLNTSVAYVVPFWRLITLSLSSVGSSVQQQNVFCQGYWCIMQGHQWAYFNFNITENIFNIKWFSIIFVTEWKCYGNDQTVSCFRSHLFCLSVKAVPGRAGEWQSTITGGDFSKTIPNHIVFPAPPSHCWDVSELYVYHSIPRRTLDPATSGCLLSCHLLSLPCFRVLC